MTSRHLGRKVQKKIDKALKKIVYVPTDEKLTFAGGLPALMELFEVTGLEEEFLKCLPERNHARSIGSLKQVEAGKSSCLLFDGIELRPLE